MIDDARAFTPREDRLREALSEYFDRYNDAKNAREMMGRIMLLTHGALDPMWVEQFCDFLFEKDAAK